MGMDRRIGRTFLHAGPGYGGSCFPKDTVALMRTAQEVGTPLRIVEAAASVNDTRKGRMASRVIAACGGSVRGKTIAVLGVAFKPNTDDMREAPSLAIIPALQDAGATVRATDPAAMAEAARLLPGVTWCADAYEATQGAHALVMLTEWNEYRGLELAQIATGMADRVLVDLRNVYPRALGEAHGFAVHRIG
jgi:UDPglucose 6-dehydrogenase